jgi:putative CocE/NonD family hydrolase
MTQGNLGMKCAVAVEYDISVPMRDGVVLKADVYRPATSGKHPVVLVRTPYDKLATAQNAALRGFDPLTFARAGYAVVVQDVRGTGMSGGELHPFRAETSDGETTIEWAAAQAWSTGAVGMAGPSYLGATQLLAAVGAHSSLRVIAPFITASEYYDGWTYQGGALQLGFALSWAIRFAAAEAARQARAGRDVTAQVEVLDELLLDPWPLFERLPLMALPEHVPLLEAGDFISWLNHPSRDAFWRSIALNERYGRFNVAALHVAGWHDIFLKGSLENYVGLRASAATSEARHAQHLIVGPWSHEPPSEISGEVWFGGAASPQMVDLHGAHLGLFDAVLKESGTLAQPRVRIFVMGDNRWREEDDWPLSRAVETRWFLRSGGGLSREAPTDELPDEFVYDPRDPVRTVGGNTLLPGAGFFAGPRDRRPVQRRPDVLSYASELLEHDLEVTGPVSARLCVSTSALDTDFTVSLNDIYPSGAVLGIADGILRLRYRDGLDAEHIAKPSEVYAIDVDLVATSNVFRTGHRIGIDVSSSNFPRFDRNPNHGGVNATATEADFKVARQLVHHSASCPSWVVLPVVPR